MNGQWGCYMSMSIHGHLIQPEGRSSSEWPAHKTSILLDTIYILCLKYWFGPRHSPAPSLVHQFQINRSLSSDKSASWCRGVMIDVPILIDRNPSLWGGLIVRTFREWSLLDHTSERAKNHFLTVNISLAFWSIPNDKPVTLRECKMLNATTRNSYNRLMTLRSGGDCLFGPRYCQKELVVLWTAPFAKTISAKK